MDKDKLEKFKIKGSKRVLFLLGGALWAFAGSRVFSLGYEDLFTNAENPVGYLLISAVVFFVFYKFIFSKMSKKHINRIMSSELEKHCIFSFFDFKSYAIMIFMIVGGITIRNSGVINPIMLGSFYLGLGFALFLGGVTFFVAGLNYKKLELKYKN